MEKTSITERTVNAAGPNASSSLAVIVKSRANEQAFMQQFEAHPKHPQFWVSELKLSFSPAAREIFTRKQLYACDPAWRQSTWRCVMRGITERYASELQSERDRLRACSLTPTRSARLCMCVCVCMCWVRVCELSVEFRRHQTWVSRLSSAYIIFFYNNNNMLLLFTDLRLSLLDKCCFKMECMAFLLYLFLILHDILRFISLN